MKFTLFSAFLFSIGWICVVTSGDGLSASCCHDVKKTRIPVKDIENYFIQEATGVCGIDAIIFHTKKGKFLCSDPNDSWAINAMKHVNKQKYTGPSEETTRCYTSTTNTIPNVSTAHKTSGTETETSMSTTAPPIVTRIETSRPETEISKTTNEPTSISKVNPESSFSTPRTCGTGGPTSPPTETRHERPGIGTVTHLTTIKTTITNRVINTTTPKKTKLSKLIIRNIGKRKKSLRKSQMGIRHFKNKPVTN